METAITEKQEKFIWLYHVENKSYNEISIELNEPRSSFTIWEEELKAYWKPISEIKKFYKSDKFKVDFHTFYNWYKLKEKDKKCFYCGITEEDIQEMQLETETKRLRGKKLEFDRKIPNLLYSNLDNIVFCCYWCNNAKTDTFTHEEFVEIGKVISKCWESRKKKKEMEKVL